MLSPSLTSEASPTLRDAMRQLAGGVSLITVGDGAARAGFTASSVTSLTLEPPCILICVNRSVSAWPDIRREGRFCVNILGEHHQALASRFSGMTGVRGSARFEHGTWLQGQHGTPVLADALASIECDLEDAIERHSHLILIGAVQSLRTNEQGTPLVYAQGHYGRITPV